MTPRRYTELADLREKYSGASVRALARRFTRAGVVVYNLSGCDGRRVLAVDAADEDALAVPIGEPLVPRPTLARSPSRAEILARMR